VWGNWTWGVAGKERILQKRLGYRCLVVRSKTPRRGETKIRAKAAKKDLAEADGGIPGERRGPTPSLVGWELGWKARRGREFRHESGSPRISRDRGRRRIGKRGEILGEGEGSAPLQRLRLRSGTSEKNSKHKGRRKRRTPKWERCLSTGRNLRDVNLKTAEKK